MNEQYLKEIINGFVLKDRRNRFLEFLKSKHRYDDFLEDLLRDSRYLDPKCIIKLPGNEQTPEGIMKRLHGLGAKKQCYLVSKEWGQDGYIGELEAIIKDLVGTNDETLVYCPEAHVGYFEGHEGWRYLLRSTSN